MLAIEHDWRLRKLIRANLEAMGLEVEEAVSGQHGLQLLRERLLREHGLDLILLDLDLPGVDAVYLLRALHDRLGEWPVPIIAISAEPPSHEILEQGYVTSYLRKPFAVPALLDQVRKALGRQIET
jgi:DNA-binding response OmpR family regulator